MTIEQANMAARHILDDRDGADYYADNGLLADYIRIALGLTEKVATQTANDISDDRKGANYYADAEILGRFLDSRKT